MRGTNVAACKRFISVNKTGFGAAESFAEVYQMDIAGAEVLIAAAETAVATLWMLYFHDWDDLAIEVVLFSLLLQL